MTRTELEAMESEPHDTSATFSFTRDARLFAVRPELVAALRKQSERVLLAPDQHYHPGVPATAVVRLGKVRISEFLPDGREVTRAVLQAGSVLTTRPGGSDNEPAAEKPPADRYDLDDIVVMALGEVELWSLPAGAPALKDLTP